MLITIPFGKKGYYSNMQQFDNKSLAHMLNILNQKNIFEKIKVNKNKWVECNQEDCKNILGILKV